MHNGSIFALKKQNREKLVEFGHIYDICTCQGIMSAWFKIEILVTGSPF